MPKQIMVRDICRWFRRQGIFVETTNRGHRYFTHPDGTKVTLPAHGDPDLTKKHKGHLLRLLEDLGYDPDEVLNAL